MTTALFNSHTVAAPLPSSDGHAFVAATPAPVKKPVVFARLVNTIMRARMAEAERRIGSYIQSHGGRLTDRIERHILDDVTGNGRGSFGL